MSTKKTVKLKESELVNLISTIVEETISVEKTKWLSEQKKTPKKNSLVETIREIVREEKRKK